MKNKKLLYILIPATLVLWGMIGYKIFSVVKNSDNPLEFSSAVTETQTGALNDTFSIHPENYRDPFLKRSIKKVSLATSIPVAEKVKLPMQTIAIQWPAIEYSGTIKNQKLNRELALIQIDGKSSIVKPGEKVNQIELVRIFRDSIEVQFGKEKKMIKKQ